MREKGIVNLKKHIVEPMLGSAEDRVSTLNGPSCYRRLHRELNKVGKIWKDTLSRIESLEYEVKEGESYWYIDDKLSVVKKTEKCTPTSKKRYLAGNYFVTYESAINMLSKIRNTINDFLASSDFPNVN